jgi:predicted Rossmann fold flavoprotein
MLLERRVPVNEKRVIVVGAGPAGMMASIRSARCGNKVLLVEQNASCGKKLLLTGKGRCNLTNIAALDVFMSRFSKNAQFLRDAFKTFFNSELITFFQERGLRLKTERQGRVFPCTDSASSVVNVLKKEMSSCGVNVLYRARAKDIAIADGKVRGVILSSGQRIPGDKIIIATGGISYPFTGSTGDGYKIAKRSGHGITTIRPALVALRVRQAYVKALEGLSLKNIQLRFISNKKILRSGIGELIFTENGISGPLVISMSAGLLDVLETTGSLKLVIDLKPGLEPKQLDLRLIRELSASPKKNISNLLKTMLPVRIIGPCLNLSGIGRDKKASKLTGIERKKITALLKAWPFDITGHAGIEKAMVTRGGVSLKDIDPKTMQSRRIKGLYFAGEILDVDADTGGFNLQSAFSTGYLAGCIHGN